MSGPDADPITPPVPQPASEVVIGVRAMEHLISRLCHDLVGPIGAINNGVELVEEAGLGVEGDAFDLIADSAAIAARRLKLFRLAFGAAGVQQSVTAADTRALLDGWFRGSRIAFNWGVEAGAVGEPTMLKLLLIACLLAEEGMPQGGALHLSGTGELVRIEGAGPQAALRAEVRLALEGRAELADLTPRSILAHAAERLAAAHGKSLTADAGDAGRIHLRLEARMTGGGTAVSGRDICSE
ncbi:MAG: hypothetical protein RLY86_2841 [Pseudomonadota bacterium]|jgi:histidine phosphotransferase ChpT